MLIIYREKDTGKLYVTNDERAANLFGEIVKVYSDLDISPTSTALVIVHDKYGVIVETDIRRDSVLGYPVPEDFTEKIERELEKHRQEYVRTREKLISMIDKELFDDLPIDAIMTSGVTGNYVSRLILKYNVYVSGRYYMKRYRGGTWLFVRNPEDSILRVPREIAGHVIGKGGRMIREISEHFKKPIKVVVVDVEGYKR